MNLRDLRYLVAVADFQNFSHAAEHCHVSQPTLSMQIRKLEETLGVSLFERTSRTVMPTELGLTIIAGARRILQEVRLMEESAAAARDPLAGTLRLGVFPTLAPYLLPLLVPCMREHFPLLRLIFVEEKTPVLLDQLRLGRIDAALLALPIGEDGFATQVLFEDDFLLAVPEGDPLADKPAVTLAELAGHRLMLLEDGHCLRDQALEVCRLSGAREEQDFRASSLETLRQMVRAGSGATLMPRLAAQGAEEGIRYVPFADPVPSRTIGLVWRRASARVTLFTQLGTVLRKLPC